MAGLYAIFGNADPRRLDAVSERMRFGDESERRLAGEVSCVWLGHDPEQRFAPAIDPATGVYVAVGGRLCWPADVWQRAEQLPYEGGVANRVVLDRFLKGGPNSVAPYNGAAMILIWDPRDRCAHVWTDQFGYHPAFVYGGGNKAPDVVTTFPDAVTADPGLDVARDRVSMAEFLRAWRITPPHTYYRDLKHAGAAAYLRIDLSAGSVSRREYWRPFEGEFFGSRSEAAVALADALRSAVSERTAVAERSALFVSGGADSRVMLFGAQDPSRVWGLNLYERPTAESSIAKALCERVGVTYVGCQRDNDYYPRMQAANVRWSGAMWSTEDNHYLGMQDVVHELGADLVMTACTTDWLFKGYGLEKTHWGLFGKNLPIKRFTDQRVDGFLPNLPRQAPQEFAAEIDERLSNWFAGLPRDLRTDRDRLLVEDRRIRPACYTVSVSGQIMFRTFPYDTFLADSRVADCYSRIPAAWKLNGDVWGLAAARVCDKAKDIVDANYGWTVNAGAAAKLYYFGKGWLKRRVTRSASAAPDDDAHPPSNASWPEYGWYARHSATLREFWESTPAADRKLMSKLWGSDPWSRSLDEWASSAHELFRILTLLEHWRQAVRPHVAVQDGDRDAVDAIAR